MENLKKNILVKLEKVGVIQNNNNICLLFPSNKDYLNISDIFLFDGKGYEKSIGF